MEILHPKLGRYGHSTQKIPELSIRVDAVSRNTQTKKYKNILLGNFEIHPGKVYRLHGNILCDKFEPEFRNFCLGMSVKGFVSIDQVSLVPLTKK